VFVQASELETNVDDEFGRIVTLTLIPTINVLQNNKMLSGLSGQPVVLLESRK
jgi:hypothetical protein